MDHFGTEEGFATYAEDLGITPASGDVAAALRRASLYITGTYEDRFVGSRPGGQLLSWPNRVNAAWPDGTVISGTPVQVEYATYEAAILELATPGSLTPNVTPGKVKRRVKVEDAVEVEYAKDWGSYDLVETMTPLSTRIEGILNGLIGTRKSLPGVAVV